MITLVEFLTARLDEDEAAARICAKVYPAPWELSDRGWVAYVKADEPNFHEVARLEQEQVAGGELAWIGDALDHIARHDPARVLREVESKRRIVELHQSWPVLVEQAPEMDLGHADTVSATVMRVTQRIAWLTQQEYRQRFGDEPPTTPILRALALPYSDHPDYRDEWKP